MTARGIPPTEYSLCCCPDWGVPPSCPSTPTLGLACPFRQPGLGYPSSTWDWGTPPEKGLGPDFWERTWDWRTPGKDLEPEAWERTWDWGTPTPIWTDRLTPVKKTYFRSIVRGNNPFTMCSCWMLQWVVNRFQQRSVLMSNVGRSSFVATCHFCQLLTCKNCSVITLRIQT